MLVEFLEDIRQKVMFEALLTATPGEGKKNFERWELIKGSSQFLVNGYAEHNTFLENVLRKILVQHKFIAVILRVSTHQYYLNGEVIYEVWGYKLWQERDNQIFYTEISHEELFQAFSVDNQTGKKITPEREVVYCGPEGKICGWDMV